jgi:hypothetical protein
LTGGSDAGAAAPMQQQEHGLPGFHVCAKRRRNDGIASHISGHDAGLR